MKLRFSKIWNALTNFFLFRDLHNLAKFTPPYILRLYHAHMD